MINKFVGIVAITAVHFTATAFAVESDQIAVAEVLILPLVPVVAWLGLANSATLWSIAWLNSLLCGTALYFAIVALVYRRPAAPSVG